MLPRFIGYFVIALTLATGPAFGVVEARADDPPRERFGFEMGPTSANYSTSPKIYSDSVTGFVLGVFFERRWKREWFFQPEIRLVQKGLKYTDSSSTVWTVHENTIEFPIMFKKKIFTQAMIQPFFMLGPALGIHLGTAVDAQNGGSPASSGAFDPQFKFWNLMLQGGAGIESRIFQDLEFFLSLRYSYGLTSSGGANGVEYSSRIWLYTAGVVIPY